jgi:ABC-type proline/glycine betaine transport system substrate-binding protein
MAFWVKEDSIFAFKGKEYGYGKELPGDLPKETLAGLIKAKKAANGMPRGEVATDVSEELRKKLVDATARIADLTAQLADANKTIEQLTNQLTAPQTAAAGPAGKK